MSLWEYTAAVAAYARSQEDPDAPEPPKLADLNEALRRSVQPKDGS